jgi:hypothetical protein
VSGPARVGLALALTLGAVVATWPATRSAVAQPPTPTATASPSVPPPDISGVWSITRTWLRGCPGCGRGVIRATPWRITQSTGAVRVDRGPRGTVVGDGVGGGWLTLDGPETDGADVYRFWYSTLRVSPDGNHFEGAFDGSESINNPCGDDPPLVTCFASAGWLTAQRVSPVATVPTPPGPPGLPTPPPGLPTPGPTETSVPTPTVPTPTRMPATATPSPLPSPSPTAHPLWRAFLPLVGREP